MLNTYVVYVENKPGVLTRVASLFRRRAFNIDSLTVGRTEKPEVSRMTITVDADHDQARRIGAADPPVGIVHAIVRVDVQQVPIDQH